MRLARWLWVFMFACAPVFAQGTGEQRAEAAGQSLIGSPAPRIVLKTIDGQTIDLGKLYGKKAVYLKFWATWCVPCREQMPHFERAYELRGPHLEVIAVNAGFNDSVEDVRTYRQRMGIKMPIVIDDGTLGAAFNLRVTPQHVVIGRDGRVQYVGHLANEQLDAAVAAAARGASGGRVAGSAGAAGTEPHAAGTRDSTAGGAAAGVGGASAGGSEAHAAGAPAPRLSVTTLDGAKFDLQAQAPGGLQPAVLVFLSPWCESYLETSRAAVSARCRDARVQVEALAKQHPQMRWLGIASGLWASPEDLRQYVTKYEVTIPLTLDESGGLFNTFHVRNVPTVIVINARGVIERRIEASDPELVAQLAQVASNR